VFETVSVDAAYYDFPRREYLQKLADAVPDDFRFCLEVIDAVTIKNFRTWRGLGRRLNWQDDC